MRVGSSVILFTDLAVLASSRGFVCLIAGERGFHWGSYSLSQGSIITDSST